MKITPTTKKTGQDDDLHGIGGILRNSLTGPGFEVGGRVGTGRRGTSTWLLTAS